MDITSVQQLKAFRKINCEYFTVYNNINLLSFKNATVFHLCLNVYISNAVFLCIQYYAMLLYKIQPGGTD